MYKRQEYLLREPLGEHSKGVVSSATLCSLVQADCRTKDAVQALTADAASALPVVAAQEVAEYLLRGPLGCGPEAIGGETLRSLLQAGCRTQPDVLRLSEEAVAALPGAAAREVAAWKLEVRTDLSLL